MTQAALFRTSGARFSPCRTYRYHLWRRWETGRPCLFVMLNPSTADAAPLDRRIVGLERRARSWGFGATTPEQRRELARHAAEARWRSRPAEEVKGRPTCEACGHLATPRGKSADGTRLRWKCLPCGKSWSTLIPVSLDVGSEVAIGSLKFRVLAFAGSVLVLEAYEQAPSAPEAAS